MLRYGEFYGRESPDNRCGGTGCSPGKESHQGGKVHVIYVQG